METNALSLTVSLSPPIAAGCTFDEDSDPSLCEFSQGEEDDFDWQLFRAHASPHATSDLLRGKPTQHSSGLPILIPPAYFTLLANYFTPRASILSGGRCGAGALSEWAGSECQSQLFSALALHCLRTVFRLLVVEYQD